MKENLSRQIVVRAVPFSYSAEWLGAAWSVVKPNYGMALGISLLTFAVGLGLKKIPLIGEVLSTIICILLAPGYLLVTQQWVQGIKPAFSKYFVAFEDPAILNRILPFVIISAICTLPVYILSLLPTELVGHWPMMVSIFITTIVGVATSFAIPLTIFKNADLKAALEFSAEGVFRNIVPLAAFALINGLLAVISSLLLLLPFILFFLPLMTAVSFMIYGSIFEELKVETISTTAIAKQTEH